MPCRLLVPLAVFLSAVVGTHADAARPLWQRLVPRKQVAAESDGDYTLAEEHGPWLILATSFTGEEGEAQARELVLELRRDFGMPAYYYGMTFQMDEANLGRGIDSYGSRIRHRYQRGSAVREHGVLVGEFPSLDDPNAQKMLKEIKQLTPEVLVAEDGESTAQSLATVRRFRKYMQERVGSHTAKGPMGHAFLTRNPLLPREYFVPQGIDEEVAKWNTGSEFNLMKCPGRYSIRVATFKGRSSWKAPAEEVEDARTRKAKEDDPLVVAVEKAHLLTVALREKGWEAYEFHDRQESYVAVGSFDEGQVQADGRVVLNNRDAKIIFNTFGAMSPNNVFNRPAPQDKMLEEQKKRQFLSALGNSAGKVAEGFHPKRFVGIPFDIYPEPVQVPRRSISSAYARR